MRGSPLSGNHDCAKIGIIGNTTQGKSVLPSTDLRSRDRGSHVEDSGILPPMLVTLVVGMRVYTRMYVCVSSG
jgi:hypothetical protein